MPELSTTPAPGVGAARRQLLLDATGIAVSVGGFGFVYGLAARNAGFSLVEAVAMSLVPFAGASQFAAVGYLSQGLSWTAIVVLTALLNARHLLYSASLAPQLRHVPFLQRAAMAQVLTDEAFALAAGHFRRAGRVDLPGYWLAALLAAYLPWNLGTLAGALTGATVPDPSQFGLDVVFPAAMGGLAIGLIGRRRELVAAGAGGVIAVALALAVGPGPAVVAGGLLGPAVALAIPDLGRAVDPDGDADRPRPAGQPGAPNDTASFDQQQTGP
jgi:4-azaleucine resistance transporter AzlC